jgi:hypothetical protein
MLPTVPLSGSSPDVVLTDVKSGSAAVVSAVFAWQPVKAAVISVKAITAHAIFLINLFILNSPYLNVSAI